ncbi:hypothetical protein KY289_019329 [Solanum tuberosum]|nr:hypothetical protein KY289_019329 [Solanum tuberosum]
MGRKGFPFVVSQDEGSLGDQQWSSSAGHVQGVGSDPFQYSNPGTVVEWKHEESISSPEVKAFTFVFWAVKPCIDGFQTCRPIISIDKTHMYGKYEIKLFIAVGVDENDNILPLAFAIVDKESKVAWKWFFRKLSTYVIKAREDMHLKSNFQSQSPNRDLNNAMRVVTAHQVRKFEALIWEI